MSSSETNYTRLDLVNGLKQTGLQLGDTVFFQVSFHSLGQFEGRAAGIESCESLCSALREVIGPGGTMLFPAYSFSFLRHEIFDVQNSPALSGTWSASSEFLEYFLHLPGVIRSADPIHSVMGLGPNANELLTELPNTSFGKDCLHERLMNKGGKICGIGVSLAEASFLNYVEETAAVPFRYKKIFTGKIHQHGRLIKQGWLSSVPIQADNGLPDGTRLEKRVRASGKMRTAHVGLGEIASAGCKDFLELASQEIARDPWTTARGPAGDPVELENLRTGGGKNPGIQLPKDASMEELISAIWRLPRDIISDGYDVALQLLATQVPMTVHQFPSGTECWSWIIPEKWTCHEAYLETLDGRRIFSYSDHPLHVVSYSLPFSGEVSREILFEHLHVHQALPDAIPFNFKYYERDWGLCCSQNLKSTLKDDRYRVVIKSNFSYGTLKVGEVIAPGKSDDTFVLCAHLCHPAMVNDDLSGVVVGLKVMQELSKRPNLRYTYRFIILPETIGSVAYLSRHENLIPKMKGGLFLEMLGLENPHALQLSFAGDTEMDQCLTQILKESDPQGWTGPFRTVVGNDERQFNAPGVRVPMLSLSRVLPQRDPKDWPFYPQYHSSHDTPELASAQRLTNSRDLVLKMIDGVEASVVPVNRYPGEVFCSRFGINIDPAENPEGYRSLFDIMFLIDGTRSVTQIAQICGISVQATLSTINLLEGRGLVDYQRSQSQHR
ncbi:MAG TPA: DUF4910 domain-containing protein [Lacunisphaera sp.]|jgi:aminopeptidase-like protein/aminoglycoside N3'-acetyltransferase